MVEEEVQVHMGGDDNYHQHSQPQSLMRGVKRTRSVADLGDDNDNDEDDEEGEGDSKNDDEEYAD